MLRLCYSGHGGVECSPEATRRCARFRVDVFPVLAPIVLYEYGSLKLMLTFLLKAQSSELGLSSLDGVPDLAL